MALSPRTDSILLLTVLALIYLCAPFSAASAQQYHPDPLEIVTDSGSVQLKVEIADDAASRAKGLMHREYMPRDAGMLFCFDEVRPVMMWMKNTPLPLDMFFIGQDGVIASIASNTEPFSTDIIASNAPVLFVLELNAGSAENFQIKNGNRVKHPVILSCASRMKGVVDAPLQ